MRAILIALVVIGLGAWIYFRPHFAMCASNGEIAEPEKESIDAAALAFVERLYAEHLGDTRDAILQLLREFEHAIADQHNRDPDGTRARFASTLDHFERSVFES